MAKSFGFGGQADQIETIAKNFIGDFLHTF
jgi:hypothetical protein